MNLAMCRPSARDAGSETRLLRIAYFTIDTRLSVEYVGAI
jgi:hypothetical protein